MKKYLKTISFAVLAISMTTACSKPISIAEDPYTMTTYKVVSHRGGASQSGAPANSISGLAYSRTIGCLAAECDIVATLTDTVVVYHPEDGTIGGKIPYLNTYAQLTKNFKLANNENLPTFQDFLNFITDKKKNPRGMVLWIDVKAWANLDYSLKAIDNAYKVVKEYDAYDLCQFMIPTSDDFFAAVQNTDMFKDHKCRVAFMADGDGTLKDPSYYKNLGVWLQAKYSAFSSSAKYKPKDYMDAGVELSIWHVSTESVEESFVGNVLQYYSNPKFRAMFVNYPANAIDRIKKATISTNN